MPLRWSFRRSMLPAVSQKDVREIVRPYVSAVAARRAGCAKKRISTSTRPASSSSAAPTAIAGLTGRKIIVDTYGGAAPAWRRRVLGQGSLPRWIARRLTQRATLPRTSMAAGLADRCTIQLSYAIGVSKPISFYVSTVNGKVDDAKLEKVLQELMDLSPRGIRKHLNLNRPIYARTAAYGHFGRAPEKDGGFSWEKNDLVEQLRSYFGASKVDASKLVTA